MILILIFFLIVFVGILSSVTDIRVRKIRNRMLIWAAAGGVLLYVIRGMTQGIWPWPQLWSGTVAGVIAFIMSWHKQWKPGDAKLFVWYAFMMPATGNETPLLLPSVQLFINAFIAGGVMCLPPLILRIGRQWREFFLYTVFNKFLYRIYQAAVRCCLTSWVMFPLLGLAGLHPLDPLSLILMFVAVQYSYRYLENFGSRPVWLAVILAAGFLLRFHDLKQGVAWASVLDYFRIILIYIVVGMIVNDAIKFMPRPRERMPFAPFLLSGFFMSYTALLPALAAFFFKIRQG